MSEVETKELKIPTSVVKANTANCNMLILYGYPKVGKTTLLSKLENALIIDLEKGSKYVDALKVEVSNLEELREVGKQIHSAGKPYKYIVLDTVTKLEDIVMPDAVKLYQNTPMGKDFKGTDITVLPNGSGYMYLRQAMKTWVGKLKTLSEHLILIGHTKDKVTTKSGIDVNVKELDLTGKISSIICQEADAVGYVYRGENSELMISFKHQDSLVAGARPTHLKGKDIKIADYNPETNDLENVNWKLIYPN